MICFVAAIATGEEKIEIPPGMAQYYVAFLKAGLDESELPVQIHNEHLESLRKSVQSGKLVCTGPLTDGAGEREFPFMKPAVWKKQRCWLSPILL
jgi:hypothetical protein